MGMHGLRLCDLCQRSIAPTEPQTVRFGNQDFHVLCYHGQFPVLVAQHAGRARQMSWRESERTFSLGRVMGS
jgi:hypothetical protein